MPGLSEKVVIVTGAGAGIGRGIARHFARAGARIVLAEFDPESGERVAAEVESLGGEALFVRTDVSDQGEVEGAVSATIARWGRVDALVNNAWGGGQFGRVEWADADALRQAFDVGALGCFWAMKACQPHMKAQGQGRIVSMASLNGVNAHMYTLPYNMAKEALRALTRTAAREWAPFGITCNIVCPAAETESTTALRKVMPELFEKTDAMMPMGRMGDPETDIAPIVAFLCSDDSRFLTGNTLFADGGSHINGSPWDPGLPEDPPR